MYQIGEVAERVELSLRTVRYYEEMELITPEKRTEGGFRLYTDDHVDRLALIKQMKPLGFSVAEMRELLDARDAVASLDKDDPKRREAAERLFGFARDVEGRTGKLRQQLAAGEELAKQLSRESRPRRKVSHRS
jgi:MerR family copper efflux transcriptional regulator